MRASSLRAPVAHTTQKLIEQESNAALRSVPCENNLYAGREIASQAHDDGAPVILNEVKNLLIHDDGALVILNEGKNLLIHDDGAPVILNEGKNLLTHDDVAPVILNEVKNLLIQKQDPSLRPVPFRTSG